MDLRWRPHWAALLLTVTIHCGLGCAESVPGGPQSESRPVHVTTVRVERRTVPRTIQAIGTVESVHSVRVISQVDGRVAAVHFAEGQEVEENQLLFSIDSRPFEAVLREREASLRRIEAELAYARAEARRRAALLEQNLIAAEEHEAVVTRVAALEAELQASQAAVAEARLQLEYCSIRSPVRGRAGQVFVHPGNVVQKFETVLTVVQQMRPVRVAFQIPERFLKEVRDHAARAPLKVVAEPSVDGVGAIAGHLEFIDHTVQRSTGTVLLKASFPNHGEELWPGQFVPVELFVTDLANALVVPRLALQLGQQGTYVFRIDDENRARPVPVTVVFEYGTEAVVEGPLEAGELIVTEGQFRLTDGTKVDLRHSSSGGSAAKPAVTP